MRFTLAQIMIATGVVGAALGLWVRNPEFPRALAILSVPIAVLAAIGYCIFIVSHLSLRHRLAVEILSLVLLLGVSALIWRPRFYTSEEERCEKLAALASSATTNSPDVRVALDREAAWFRRRASDLRRRGLWLGLTMGPSTRDDGYQGQSSLTYELGTLESIEKHEKIIRALLSDSGEVDPE